MKYQYSSVPDLHTQCVHRTPVQVMCRFVVCVHRDCKINEKCMTAPQNETGAINS